MTFCPERCENQREKHKHSSNWKNQFNSVPADCFCLFVSKPFYFPSQQAGCIHSQLTSLGRTVLGWMFPLASVIAAKLVLVLEEEDVVVEEVASLEMEVMAPSVVVPRLDKEVFSPVVVPVGGLGRRLLSHGWRNAWLGVILSAGSHSRHCLRKSRNSGSSQPFSAALQSLLPGGPRTFPRRDRPPFSTVVPSGSVVTVQYRGYPLDDTKFLALLEASRSFWLGMPSSSIMQANWSASSSPGSSG